MKKLFISTLLIASSVMVVYAQDQNQSNIDQNSTQEHNVTKQVVTADTNSSQSNAQLELEKQMEREKKYAKEQRFYQGSEYDLSSFEVNKNSLDSIPLIEPDYDFDMDDVYD